MVNMVSKHDVLTDGAEAHDVVESHNEVVLLKVTTTTVDGAHNEQEAHGDVNTSHSEAVTDVARLLSMKNI
jgi:dTDP-4-dehydrorhamnose reductase